MDEIDFKIIDQLNTDARKSFRDIAKVLAVSPGTVYNRIKKLEEDKIITAYIPVVDAQKAGLDLTAIIGLKIAHGKLMEVEKKIAKDPRVFGVYDVTGEFDSVILARFRSREELDHFVKGLLALKDIEHTYTQLALNTVKEEKRFQLI